MSPNALMPDLMREGAGRAGARHQDAFIRIISPGNVCRDVRDNVDLQPVRTCAEINDSLLNLIAVRMLIPEIIVRVRDGGPHKADAGLAVDVVDVRNEGGDVGRRSDVIAVVVADEHEMHGDGGLRRVHRQVVLRRFRATLIVDVRGDRVRAGAGPGDGLLDEEGTCRVRPERDRAGTSAPADVRRIHAVRPKVKDRRIADKEPARVDVGADRETVDRLGPQGDGSEQDGVGDGLAVADPDLRGDARLPDRALRQDGDRVRVLDPGLLLAAEETALPQISQESTRSRDGPCQTNGTVLVLCASA